MIRDALAIAARLAPAQGAAPSPSPSLAEADAALRTAQRWHRRAPALGVVAGALMLVAVAHVTRDR